MDLLTLIADQTRSISYHPRWNELTGSLVASILLQQVIYRWVSVGKRPFYKFTSPCGHFLYRAGDSWEEELGITRHVFESARSAIAIRTEGEIDPNHMISYWVNRSTNQTFYAVNEEVVAERLGHLYDLRDNKPVGVQSTMPLNASTTSENQQHRSKNSETPLPKNGNAISENSHSYKQRSLKDNNRDNTDKTSSSPVAQNVCAQTPQTDNLTDDDAFAEADSSADVRVQTAEGDTTTVPDPNLIAELLTWMGFDGRLTSRDGYLTLPDLLAWGWWVKIKQADGQARNPVGLARSQWSSGEPPPKAYLELAEAWLVMNDSEKRELLHACEDSRFSQTLYLPEWFTEWVSGSLIGRLYLLCGSDFAPPFAMPLMSWSEEEPATAVADERPEPKPFPTHQLLWETTLVTFNGYYPQLVQWLDKCTYEPESGTIYAPDNDCAFWLHQGQHALTTLHQLLCSAFEEELPRFVVAVKK